jgi:uncharacterized protein involved in response to NO
MTSSNRHCPVLLQTGFRIFFFGAAVYAVFGMAFWYLFYVASGNIFVAMPLTVWHGHEMIFGFTMAVVAGFLLTAVMNWTGQPTLNGIPLLILFLLWFIGRVLAFMPATVPTWPLASSSLIFIIFLTAACMRPIIAGKHWQQSAVFSKVIFIFISAAVFYIALIQNDLAVERKALRFAVYMIISLTLTIGRKIIPFFVERGVGYPVTLRNNKVFDIASLIGFLLFSILDVFWPQRMIIILLCVFLTFIHVFRLAGWHTTGIWKKPLLWVLFIGYIFIITGFVLKAVAVLGGYPDDAALHAWTAGGIGIFTLGMMARVAWGHTGRIIAEPPRHLSLIFSAVILSAAVRVFFPLMNETRYILWIGISQIMWILAFLGYLLIYTSVLTSPRVDGKWG